MFVGSLTTAMTRLQMVSSQQAAQFLALRHFLQDHGISARLSLRVFQNAQHAMDEKKRNVTECSVELLAMISEPLLVELHFEIYAPPLLTHPFFDCLEMVNPGGVRRLCHVAVSSFALDIGDILFSDLEVPHVPRMYFVESGVFDYECEQLPLERAEHGDWMCEAVLWTSWSHCGTMRAMSRISLLGIEAQRFQSILETFQG